MKKIDIINEDNGFNVVGWYKCGIINYKIIIVNENNNDTFNVDGKEKENDGYTQVDAGDISHHMVQIIPHN